MNELWDYVWWVRLAAEDNLKAARRKFAEAFGLPITDKKINAKIEAALEAAINRAIDDDDPGIVIALPVEVVLAITLREGFRLKRGRPLKSTLQRRSLCLAIAEAKKLTAKYRAEGLSKGAARERAIKEAEGKHAPGSITHTPGSIIRDQMGRSRKPRK